MDPVAIDLFDALTVDLETIDLDVSTERLHQYIRYHLRSMVYLVVSSVYQDEFGAELRDSYSREEMKIIRHHVKLLCDFLTYLLEVRWVIKSQNKDSLEEPFPMEVVASVFLVRRMFYSFGFSGDRRDDQYLRVNDCLRHIEEYGRQSRNGDAFDFLEADTMRRMHEYVERNRAMEGLRVTRGGFVHTLAEEGLMLDEEGNLRDIPQDAHEAGGSGDVTPDGAARLDARVEPGRESDRDEFFYRLSVVLTEEERSGLIGGVLEE